MNRPGILETKLPEKEVNRMTKNTRFSPEVRPTGSFVWFWKVRAKYDSQWAAICSIAPKDWLYAGDPACLGSPAMSGIPGSE